MISSVFCSQPIAVLLEATARSYSLFGLFCYSYLHSNVTIKIGKVKIMPHCTLLVSLYSLVSILEFWQMHSHWLSNGWGTIWETDHHLTDHRKNNIQFMISQIDIVQSNVSLSSKLRLTTTVRGTPGM